MQRLQVVSSSLHSPSGYICRKGKVSWAEWGFPSPLAASMTFRISRRSAAVSFRPAFSGAASGFFPRNSPLSFANNPPHLLFHLYLPLQGGIEVIGLVWPLLRTDENRLNDLGSDHFQRLPITTNAMAKMGKGGDVSTQVLSKICNALDCKLEDIVELDSEKKS